MRSRRRGHGRCLQEERPELMAAMGEFMSRVGGTDELSEAERIAGLRALWLDTYFPAASADPEATRPALERSFADAEMVVFHSSGHFAPTGEPERFRRVVYRFLGMSG